MSGKIHFGVYGLILSGNKKEVLAVKKTKGPYKDWYDMPGGTLEEGETEYDTLVRELKEETGATITDASDAWHIFDLTVTKDSGGGNIQFRHTGKWKLLQVAGVVTGNRDADDVSFTAWLPVEQLLREGNISAPLKLALETKQPQ